MAVYLDEFIKELLHLDDVRANRLLDAGQDGANIKSYKLFTEAGSACAKMIGAIKRGVGKVSNRTVLYGSALVKTNVDNPQVEKWLWRDLNGSKDPRLLDKFISDAYSVINLKGNNPLFLGVGAISWETAVSDEIKTITSPLLIFPIKLIRGTATSSVEIEFVDDDAYFNPCLFERMKRDLSGYVTEKFPHPNKAGDFDAPIDIEKLDLGYFDLVEEHIRECAHGSESFCFDRESLIIAQYNHSDVCMYYDVLRNREKIEAHPLISRIFGGEAELPPADKEAGEPRFVLPKDSVQEDIVRRIAQGESLIVKGPPGTGKTLTIANMAASLMARGKSVLFASKKLSALSEVYAKLPERLRKFTMLLDCETEQKASAVNPSEIKKDLKALLKSKKEFHFDGEVSNEYERAVSDCASAVLDINEYFQTVFASGYYDCADEFLKSDLPAVEFADPQSVYKVGSKKFGELLSKVESASKYYAVMSGDGKITDCPWFGVDPDGDLDGAIALNSDICRGAERILGVLEGFGDVGGLRLGDLYLAVCENALSREDMKKILSADISLAELDGLIADAENTAPDFDGSIEFPDGGDYEKLFMFCPDSKLTCAEILRMNSVKSLFVEDGKVNSSIDMPRLLEIHQKAEEYENKADCLILDVLSVLDLLKEDDYAVLQDMLPAFAKYADGEAESPSAFDFKVKKHCKYLQLKSSKRPSFKDIAGAMKAMAGYFECLKQKDALLLLVDKCFGKRLTKDEARGVVSVAQNCKGDLRKYFNAVSVFVSVYEKCFNTAFDCTAEALQDAYFAHIARKNLSLKVKDICALTGISEGDNALNTAKSIRATVRAGGLKAFKNSPEKLLDFLEKLNLRKDEISELSVTTAQKLRAFGTKYFENLYTLNPWAVTADGFRRFISQAEDRSALNCSAGYEEILHDSDNALDLSAFFGELERGNVLVEHADIPELFAHSCCKLKLDYMLSAMGRRRNGLGKNALYAYEKFQNAEAEVLRCNARIIENLLMSRLDADDPDFDFLNADRGASQSLRYLFKTRADAILKLKKCFIISPSTASVLFRPEAYSHFDVVIIDEASQLEPVNLLPVLFRSKQCVLVGDEYQMPPLAHFKVKNRRRIDDDSELSLDTDISALSLALHNGALPATELTCHYRSNTEALIAFSQREFYPYMRTFPSAEPFKSGLGFEDVLTPDGVCDGGVNDIEARKVVEILEDHFRLYFDSASGRLSKPVGVVAFGEAQLKHIMGLIQKNAPLRDKIETAVSRFDDVPEKLVFFRTIETVQGQETDRLILSLTYGRDVNGAVNLRFGELNRDALGKNIFNVAVTRAQSMVTIVHSLTADRIAQNPRISFIADYLKLAEKFAEGGRTFVSSVPEKGANFTERVKDCLLSCGIEPERIAVNYGVTDGSVKIPIAVLSKDKTRAVLGVWCEYPVLKKYDYLDYNVRYVRSLESRGWNIHRICIHEWLDNNKFETEALVKRALAVKNI